MRAATEAMVCRRAEADAKAHDAIALVEKRLVEVLAGGAMRGLPDLGGKCYGLRVGVEGSAFAALPQRRACLVLESKGLLVIASLHGDVAVQQRITRGFARASVLVPYMRTVRTAIDLHRRYAERRGEDFRKIATLAERIVAAMT